MLDITRAGLQCAEFQSESHTWDPPLVEQSRQGFEIVADFMENPLGDDSSDISIYESIHEFEVEAQAIFNSSLIHRPGLSASEQELAEEFGLKTDCLREWADDGPPDFNDFFEWSPLPSQLVNYIRHQSTDAAALNTWASLCSLAGQRHIGARLSQPNVSRRQDAP